MTLRGKQILGLLIAAPLLALVFVKLLVWWLFKL